MAYATEEEWGARYGHLSANLEDGELAIMLNEATAACDDFMGRRNMEPAHRQLVLEHRANRLYEIFLPDYPPKELEKWFCQLESFSCRQPDNTFRWQIDNPEVTCIKLVHMSGRVILPKSVTVHNDDLITADYYAGYGSIDEANEMTRLIPDVLRLACLEWTKSLVFTALGQRGEFDLISEAGIAKSKAQELLMSWRRIGVSGAGSA